MSNCLLKRGYSSSHVGQVFEGGASGLFGADLKAEWKDVDEITKQYKLIFFLYRVFGDNSAINRCFISRLSKEKFSRLIRRPLPGWYDTHARHSSFDSKKIESLPFRFS